MRKHTLLKQRAALADIQTRAHITHAANQPNRDPAVTTPFQLLYACLQRPQQQQQQQQLQVNGLPDSTTTEPTASSVVFSSTACITAVQTCKPRQQRSQLLLAMLLLVLQPLLLLAAGVIITSNTSPCSLHLCAADASQVVKLLSRLCWLHSSSCCCCCCCCCCRKQQTSALPLHLPRLPSRPAVTRCRCC